jgi:hypothetical protein
MTKNRILPALGAIAALAVGTWLLYEPHDHSQHSGHGAGHQPPTIAERMSFFGPGQVNPDFRYVARTATYSTNVIGDGTTANGGTPPAAFEEPPDIPSNFAVAKWMQDAVENGDCYYDTAFPATRPPGCPIRDGLEAKFRTHCNYSHSAAVDPVLYPNQVNRSHLHSFFGNRAVDQFTTYESACAQRAARRAAAARSTAPAYWYPAVLKDNALGDGKTMIVKMDLRDGVLHRCTVPRAEVDPHSARPSVHHGLQDCTTRPTPRSRRKSPAYGYQYITRTALTAGNARLVTAPTSAAYLPMALIPAR